MRFRGDVERRLRDENAFIRDVNPTLVEATSKSYKQNVNSCHFYDSISFVTKIKG
jgi:hypothetical protein